MDSALKLINGGGLDRGRKVEVVESGWILDILKS